MLRKKCEVQGVCYGPQAMENNRIYRYTCQTFINQNINFQLMTDVINIIIPVGYLQIVTPDLDR